MSTTIEEVWAALEDLADPEIPVISLRELGILREVRSGADGLEVVITPTYSGCPAMGQIEDDVRSTLKSRGISARIVTQLAPAWTTDWMSEAGKQKLSVYGIAPPEKRFTIPGNGVECPRCHSVHTRLISAFGSTACKALYQCNDCKEPFDYFKCH